MQTYNSYKNSGIDWIGQIPEHWEVKPGFTVLKERKERNKGMISNNVLSLSYGKIIEKPVEKLTGLVPENFETYQLVYEGDIIFRPTDLQNDKVSLRTGLSKFNGIITSAYINLQPINTEPIFLHYFLHTTDTNKVIYGLGSGLRQNISFLDFKRFGFVIPPIQEQKAIAKFLDDKTAKIDALVQTKEQQIEKLKELRQVKIHQAVTKGLDATAPTKDSGVEWIGEIPSHWEVEKFKNILDERNEKNDPIKSRERLSLSIDKGVTLYSEKTTNLDRFKDDFTQYKLAHKNDLVFNSMNMIVGAVGVSSYFGCVSPVYYTYYSKNNCNSTKFYEYLFRSKVLQQILYGLGRGIMAIDRGEGKFNTVRLKVSRYDLRSLNLPLPSHTEQNEIVNFLDEFSLKIDQAIALKTEQIEKLKAYKQSLINEVVTGKVKVC